jgi:hypothetical protein
MGKVLRGFRILEQAPIGSEFVEWVDRCCPDCHGLDFFGGPRGGMCRNIECCNCGSRFNVAIWRGVRAVDALFAGVHV